MKKRFKKAGKILLIIAATVILLIVGYNIKEKIHINSIIKIHAIDKEDSSTNQSNNTIKVTTGVQQIMIGTLCNNYDNALQTLQNIKAAGYESIELNDFMIQKSSLLIKAMTKFSGMPIGNGGKLDWPRLIEESGLEVVSLHSNLNSIEEDPKAVADQAKLFGTKYVVITGMYQFDYSDLDSVKELSQRLNATGEALLAEDISLLYHNHNCELQKVTDTQTAYDIIIEETDSDYVNFEFDSYWMTEGGANVPTIMEKLGSRMKLWHINDRGCNKSGPYMTPILKEGATELGNGNMDLDTLAKIAIDNGVEGIILETHNNWINDDPIESFQISGEYLQDLLND